ADNKGNEGEGLDPEMANHGNLIYITFEDGVKPRTSAFSAGKQPASTVESFEPTTNTSSSSALNVKQEAVNDYREKQSGFIKRGRDPKFDTDAKVSYIDQNLKDIYETTENTCNETDIESQYDDNTSVASILSLSRGISTNSTNQSTTSTIPT
ncbi:9183_t:CDS:2, partial [Ambispora gerdemannii]